MLLKELFSKEPEKTHSSETLIDDLCFYIEHDDDLQKEYFLPAARMLKRKNILDDTNKCAMEFKDLVELGCNKYQEEFKLVGNFEEIYTKEIKEAVCKKLAERQVPHIKDGAYDPKEV